MEKLTFELRATWKCGHNMSRAEGIVSANSGSVLCLRNSKETRAAHMERVGAGQDVSQGGCGAAPARCKGGGSAFTPR